jgi:mRNA interferase RelE/StbE
MPFKIQYYPEVFKDLEALTDEEYEEVDAYIEKLKSNPLFVSLPLEDLGDNLLSECRKIYVANASIRIVIRVINNQIHIVELIAIGPRAGGIVYDEAYRRLVDSGIGL